MSKSDHICLLVLFFFGYWCVLFYTLLFDQYQTKNDQKLTNYAKYVVFLCCDCAGMDISQMDIQSRKTVKKRAWEWNECQKSKLGIQKSNQSLKCQRKSLGIPKVSRIVPG